MPSFEHRRNELFNDQGWVINTPMAYRFVIISIQPDAAITIAGIVVDTDESGNAISLELVTEHVNLRDFIEV